MKEPTVHKSKIGEGHLGTMGRLGLEELRNAMYPSSNVAEPNSMYGLYGTKTPGEVAEDRRSGDSELTKDEEPKPGGYLAQRLQEAKKQSCDNDRDREQSLEMDRD